MKKSISVMLSILMIFSCISIYQIVIIQKAQQNSILIVREKVSELVNEYDAQLINDNNNKDIQRTVNTNRLIVKTKEQIDLLNAVDYVKGLGFYFVQFEDYDSAKFAIDYYKSKGLTVEFDSLIKNSFSDEASASTTDDQMWAYKRVGSDKAIEYLSNKSLNNVTVAVLDTGVDYTHELFTDRITRTDLNFSNSGMENDCMDSNGHGTSVAGIVALSTPYNVKIEPYRIGEDNGDLLFSNLYCAFEYLLSKGISNHPNILNMSFSSNLTEHEIIDYYFEKLDEANYTIIASAGNENSFAKNWIPACYNNILIVSSSNIDNKRSSFSNFGETVDVAAPGENVYTALIGGGYITDFSGTSASAPLTSGAAAILLSVDKNLSNTEVYAQIEATATDIQIKGYADWCGSGIINFEKLTKQPITDGEVIFSIDEGDYYDDAICVELSSSNPNAIIKYSTDLTIPNNENGITYTEPILVENHTAILATVIEPGKLAGKYSLKEYNVIYHADETDFEIESDGTISSYNGTISSIIIPDTINGIVPTTLGDSLFENNLNIKHVELPKSIKKIGLSAFSNSSIQSIIGIGVTRICSFAFEETTQLYYEYLPNTKTVDAQVFSGCINLTKQLSFQNSLQRLDEYVFVNVPIETMSFPNITKSILKSFVGCLAVEINLPNVTSFQEAFSSCYYLTKIYAPKVTKIGSNTFYDCYSLENFDFSNIEVVSKRGLFASYFTDINLENCTSIADEAFGECKAKKISLPKITQIPSACFYQCRYLEELLIPNVEYFDNESSIVFSNVYCLKQLIMPKACNFPIIRIYAYENGPWWTESLQEMELEVIYAPKVTEIPDMTTSEHDANDNVTSRSIFELLNNVELAFLPSLENGNNLPWSEGMMLYLSENFNYSKNISQAVKMNYTVIAPTISYAEQWANENGHTFIPSEELSFESIDGKNFVYSTPDGKTCSMPIDIVEQMWYDYLPINKKPDFMTHGYLIDVVNDNFINGKDFAKIHHTAKYGW